MTDAHTSFGLDRIVYRRHSEAAILPLGS